MAITLVPKYVRAVAEQLNAYYRVLKGVDADSVELRLPGGGRFAVHHSGTNAIVFQVTDAGATGSYQPGDIGTPDLADGAVTSAKILDQAIVDADINNAAAIALGKLADLGANNVLRSSGAGNVAGKVVSGDIADGTIVDIDVNAGANVALTKLVHVGPGNVLRSNGSQNVGGPLVAADIPNNSITSAKIVDNEIVNGDINSAAGISYGKLALGNSIVNADVAGGAAIAYGKLALGSSIVNADVAGGAAIAVAKLADLGANNVLRSSGAGNVAGKVVSGDIADGTIVNADIAAAGVANIDGAKLADLSIPSSKLITGAPIGAGSVGTAELAANAASVTRLDYKLTTDNTHVSPLTTWTDMIPNQSFTVQEPGSIVLISSLVGTSSYSGASSVVVSGRVIVDSDNVAQAAQSRIAGSDSGTDYRAPFQGNGVWMLANLVVGTHKVKLQTYSTVAAVTMTLTPATDPNSYGVSLHVAELKR